MKKISTLLATISASFLFSQNIAFDKLYGNSEPQHYFLGHYPVVDSDGLQIKWHGGIRFTTGGSTALQITGTNNVGIGIENPQALLDVYKHLSTNSNEVIGIFRREGTPTGGSAIFRVGYHSFADLEVNAGYASTALRYGDYFDFNIVNNHSGGTHGAINFITNSKLQMKIFPSGNASIYGKFEANEVKVTTTPTADFVFAEDYNLPALEEVEKHIKEKKHLPEIASAKEMEKEGVNIGEFQIKLLQKIEELTLYTIEQNKRIKNLEEKLLENKNK